MFSLNNPVPIVLTNDETPKYKKPVMRKAKFVNKKIQYARIYKKNIEQQIKICVMNKGDKS